MWLLIKQRTLLRRAGQLCRFEGQRMQRTIHAALKKDHAARTAQVGESIIAELVKGNVHEAFRHLKGWYRSATEMQTRPCIQTMEKQTMERVNLYRQRNSPGPPLIINVGLLTGEIWDDRPTNGEIRAAVAELTNGRSAGASRMQAEHLKELLKLTQVFVLARRNQMKRHEVARKTSISRGLFDSLLLTSCFDD